MSALTIFSMSVKHLRNMLLEDVRNSKLNVDEKDIQYVITVPAIWSDAAKQFMKEAAQKVTYS